MEMNTVTVYDIQNKFIAYSAPFPAVIGVFCEWGSLYVLAGDRKVSDSCFCLLNVFIEALCVSFHLAALLYAEGQYCKFSTFICLLYTLYTLQLMRCW